MSLRGREDLAALQTGDPGGPDYLEAVRGTLDEPPEVLPRPRGAVVVDQDTGAVYASWAPAYEVLAAIAAWRIKTAEVAP